MEKVDVEIWVPIEDARNYEISSWGRVYSHLSKKVLSPKSHDHRSPTVYYKDVSGVQRTAVNVLVAKHFTPDYVDGVLIKHLDGDKTNCHVDNLYFVDWTSREPRESDVEHYAWARKARVIEWDRTYMTVRELADDIGGDLSSVYKVLRGEQGRHLGLTFEYVD